MAYTVHYYADGKEVAEVPWNCDIPPTTKFAKDGLRPRAADTAVIRDESGKDLVSIREKRS